MYNKVCMIRIRNYKELLMGCKEGYLLIDLLFNEYLVLLLLISFEGKKTHLWVVTPTFITFNTNDFNTYHIKIMAFLSTKYLRFKITQMLI